MRPTYFSRMVLRGMFFPQWPYGKPITIAIIIFTIVFTFVHIHPQDCSKIFNLPNKQALTLLNMGYPALNTSLVEWTSDPIMPRAVSKRQYDDIMALLKFVTSLLDEYKVTYFMTGGTLLGSYFAHDILPWDDDVDLLIHRQDFLLVEEILDNPCVAKFISSAPLFGADDDVSLKGELDISVGKYQPKRIHSLHQMKTKSLPWTWPFIDLIFYDQNATHIWNMDIPQKITFYKKSITYPLHRRPLGSLWLPAPNQSRKFLNARYKEFLCQPSPWNHILWQRRDSIEVDCNDLKNIYPFVERQQYYDGIKTIEKLTLGGKVIQTIVTGEVYKTYLSQFGLE